MVLKFLAASSQCNTEQDTNLKNDITRQSVVVGCDKMTGCGNHVPVSTMYDVSCGGEMRALRASRI